MSLSARLESKRFYARCKDCNPQQVVTDHGSVKDRDDWVLLHWKTVHPLASDVRVIYWEETHD